ncbi:MAG TPA: hypothetical protein VK439_05600 [Rubrivivax sp.]|nr:hypothetical protein [Rubrivivax sp.]
MLTQLFDPLQRAAIAFFKHDVALRRTNGSVQLVLQQRGGPPPKPTRQELALIKEQQDLALMQRQLADLLAGLPQARQSVPHLLFVQRALAKQGLEALHTLPLDVLRSALAQLERLVTNWSPEGLANLRSKMAVSIIDRGRVEVAGEGAASPTAAVLDAASSQLPSLGEVSELGCDDEEALAAAYAALGSFAPTAAAGQPEQSDLRA